MKHMDMQVRHVHCQLEGAGHGRHCCSCSTTSGIPDAASVLCTACRAHTTSSASTANLMVAFLEADPEAMISMNESERSGQQKPLDNTMCFTKCCSSQIILHWWSYNEKLAAGAVNAHVSGYHRHVRWKTLHEALGPCNCWLNAIACSCHELHGTTPSMARSNARSVKEGHV